MDIIINCVVHVLSRLFQENKMTAQIMSIEQVLINITEKSSKISPPFAIRITYIV